MATRSVQINETERIHFFFPDFKQDVAIIKERKMESERKVQPMMVLPGILLENVIAIRLTDDISRLQAVCGRLLPESADRLSIAGYREDNSQ